MDNSLIQVNVYKRSRRIYILLAAASLILSVLAGCGGPSTEDLAAVDYTPLVRDDWEVSTPEAEGLDPLLVARMYYEAQKRDTLYGLLVVKDAKLIAEDYFNGADINEMDKRASVGKSYVSALTGIAIDKGLLPGLEEKMLDYFSDVPVTDPRKWDITVRDMLQMRAGFPSEEKNQQAWDIMYSGEYLSAIEDLPLSADPGAKFQYSNLTAHWTGIIAARSAGLDLMSLGKEYLFGPLGVTPGEGWNRDVDGYYWGGGDILFTARDMARFGQLYLDDGSYNGEQIISAAWVNDSLATYTEKAWGNIGKFHDIGYGYYWWSAMAGEHPVNFAWGHGGNLIVQVHDLDMVVVATADPFHGQDVHGDAWNYEKAIIGMVSDFIYSLPVE